MIDPKFLVHDGDFGLAIKFGVVTAAPGQQLLIPEHPLPFSSTAGAPHFISFEVAKVGFSIGKNKRLEKLC